MKKIISRFLSLFCLSTCLGGVPLFAQHSGAPYNPPAENLQARQEFRDKNLEFFSIGAFIACLVRENGI